MQEATNSRKKQGKPGAADKSARLAEALRANLARRKAQKRARSDENRHGDKQDG